MIDQSRKHFNKQFTAEKYQQFLSFVGQKYGHSPVFRIAETPVFLSKDLKIQLIEACEELAAQINQKDFKKWTDASILPGQNTPGEDDHTTFLQMDFGICEAEDGSLIPQLIEAQGFPSLYFFQHLLAEAYDEIYDLPKGYEALIGGISSEEYLENLREIIVGDEAPEEVVLLEIEPGKQITQIDFIIASKLLGIKTLCISKVIVEGDFLYYENEAGKKISIKRIFNRVIFDELDKRDDLKRSFDFAHPYKVEWIGHPNWFFRISKYTMPYLKSKYAPECQFLKDLTSYPEDLENYVLKPLFSFAGEGVVFNLTKADLDNVKDPSNFILQKKVKYAAAVKAPGEPVKCEIRMLMLWPKGADAPVIVNNLARLSKGSMIGVRYNKDKDWVGGSIGYFQKD